MTFRLLNIKVKISFWFVTVITTLIVIQPSRSMILTLSAALIHEMGHIIIMILVGQKPGYICFNIFDIDIKDSNRSRSSYKNDLLILLGGPIINFIMASIGLTYCFLYKNNDTIIIFALENLFLGIFNILPIESLDGGQILYILLSKKFSTNVSIRLVEIVSFVVLIPIFTVGFFMLLKSKYNFSLLLISCYLMAIILMKRGKVY